MRTILITGCSTGIGWACANALKDDTWDVHATARTPEDLAKLTANGINAYHLDYTDTKSIHDTFNAVIEKTDGRLDALFNNGAYGQPGAVEDLTTDVLRQQFEANFFGWHELTRLCLPIMRQQGHGRIVQCSSILGWVAAPWRGAYNASKFALEGLTNTMRMELAGTSIHVSLIEPGPVNTEFSKTALDYFHKHIDIENSANHAEYQKQLARLKKQSRNAMSGFTVEPQAVYRKLHHALNAKKPKPHYPVTVPTHFMSIAQRILPQTMIDKIVMKGS